MTRINKIDLRGVYTKTATAFLCLTLAVAMVWPTPTRAQSMTVAELQAVLNQLLDRLQQLQSGGTIGGVCSYTWTRSLGQGSTGTDVMRLQQFLNTSPDTRLAVSGAGSPGMETQYYGPITASAVSKFQVKYRATVLTPIGLVNPTGYFGPMSRAEANRLCNDTIVIPPGDDDDDNGGNLQGGAGSLDDFRLVTSINNEEVGEGENDIEVLGLEFEADGSDVEVLAVTVDFDQVTADDDFEDYADEVSIWLDGEEYATVDADEFDDDNDYRDTITLDRGAIVREGDVGELVVAVSGVNNLDSDYEGDRWEVVIDNVRFRDALGASISDSQMDNLSRDFSFEEFAASAGLEVRVRSGDDDINDTQMIEVSTDDSTDDVPVLSFLVEVEGDSEIEVEDMSVNIETTGGDIDDIVSAAYLYLEGDEVGSVNINDNDNTITFDDLDLTLDSDETYEFEVALDILAADNYSSGATVDVDVLASNVDAWDMEDEQGDDVSDSDRRGSASADAHTLLTQGVGLELVDSSTQEVYNSSTPSSSYGQFRMVLDVRAVGDTIYVPQTATRDNAASTSAGLTYYFENGDGDEYAAGSGTHSFTRVSGGNIEGNFVRINEGQTARFELVATLNPDDFGQYRAQMVSVGWNDTAASPDGFTLAHPDSNFRSGLQVISD